MSRSAIRSSLRFRQRAHPSGTVSRRRATDHRGRTEAASDAPCHAPRRWLDAVPVLARSISSFGSSTYTRNRAIGRARSGGLQWTAFVFVNVSARRRSPITNHVVPRWHVSTGLRRDAGPRFAVTGGQGTVAGDRPAAGQFHEAGAGHIIVAVATTTRPMAVAEPPGGMALTICGDPMVRSIGTDPAKNPRGRMR